MRGALISLLLACAACGLKTRVDGGEGGEAGGSAGGAAGGASAGGGATAGGSTAGGATAGGASGGTAGGQLPFQYASVVVPTGGAFIAGISGRPGELYAVSDVNANALFRSTGGAFTEVGTNLVSGRGVYVASDGSVFPVGARQLGSCRTSCSSPGSYTFQAVSDTVQAVCGDSATNVYAAVEVISGSVASLWRWGGSSWSQVVPNLGITQPRACAVLADGRVVVAGGSEVATWDGMVTSAVEAATSPPLTSSELLGHMWYGIAAVGSRRFVVGYYGRISMFSGGAWTMAPVTGTTGPGTYFAVGGPSENEVFAGGGPIQGAILRRFDGQTWSMAPNPPTVLNVRSIYVAGPNEIWLGGHGMNNDPAIDKLYR